MANDYGVYKENQDGTLSWVVTEIPLVLGDANHAIDNLSYADACTVAMYLTQQEGETYATGRPGDRQPHH